GGVICPIADGVFTCALPRLRAGETVSPLVSIMPQPAETLYAPPDFTTWYERRVRVRTDAPDPAPGNDAAAARTFYTDCDAVSAFCFLNQLVCKPPALPPASPARLSRGLLQAARLVAPLDLSVFHALRDKVFGATPAGRRYTRLYYAHTAEVLALLVS